MGTPATDLYASESLYDSLQFDSFDAGAQSFSSPTYIESTDLARAPPTMVHMVGSDDSLDDGDDDASSNEGYEYTRGRGFAANFNTDPFQPGSINLGGALAGRLKVASPEFKY